MAFALTAPHFERGVAERRTLTAGEVASRRDMKSSASTDGQRQQLRPRSKSAGRTTSTPKKDASRETDSSPVGRGGLGPPASASTPRSTADPDAARGERLSNYGQGTLLVGRRGTCPPPAASPGVPSRSDGASRLVSGRRSVDAAMTGNVASRDVDGDRVGELASMSAFSYTPTRRRCITPVNEATPPPPLDTTSLFAGYQLRRPQLPTTPTVPDTETPSYLAGRRSLPRTGRVLPQGYPASPVPFYHTDSSHVLSRGTASCTPAAVPYCMAPCSVNARPQSSATTTSTVSGSADNIREIYEYFTV